MKNKVTNSNHNSLVEIIEAKQRNTVWPDTMINSRGVDEFLWKGDPNAPLVQRMAAWIFGIFFILIGVGWLDAGYEKHSLIVAVLSILWFLLGGKVLLNGFRRHKAEKSTVKGK
jgi:hypothetical protein